MSEVPLYGFWATFNDAARRYRRVLWGWRFLMSEVPLYRRALGIEGVEVRGGQEMG